MCFNNLMYILISLHLHIMLPFMKTDKKKVSKDLFYSALSLKLWNYFIYFNNLTL